MIRRTAAPVPAVQAPPPARRQPRPGQIDLAAAPSAMERLAASWSAKA